MNKVILMPVDIASMDLSDKAVAYAESMRSTENSMIKLLHIFPFMYGAMLRSMAYDARKFETQIVNDAEEKMKILARKFENSFDKIEIEVRFGSIRDEINNAAKDCHANIIIIGSRRPGIKKYVLGSTAESIIRYSQIPVLVVR